MNRVEVFAFRVSNEERRAIVDLATRLQRSQSDAVRFVVVEAARQLIQADSVSIADLPKQMQEIKHEGENVTS